MQTPEQRPKKGSVKKKVGETSGDDKNATQGKFGSSKLAALMSKGADTAKKYAKNAITASEARKKDQKKFISSEHLSNLSQEDF